MMQFLYGFFERPWFLFLIFPLIIAIYYLMKHDFFKGVKVAGVEVKSVGSFGKAVENKISMKTLVLISRILIVILLCVALAYPYVDSKKIIQGDPRVKMLFDNSTSMQLYNTSWVSSLRKTIEEELPVDFVTIGNGDNSNIGDSLIGNVRKDDNLLLISDANSNRGISFEDAIINTMGLNVTISAIKLQPVNYDSSVSIIGPDKTTAKSENKFTIKIEQDMPREVHVVVSVGGEVIADKFTKEGFSFTKSFEAGHQKIKAEILDSDYFKQNNVFYKTVKVVPKPKLLFLSAKESPLMKLIEPVYDITLSSDLNLLNGDLKKYSAIILNDYNSGELNNYISALSNFAIEGNGLFVIGGKNSYESGDYKGSKFEQILPAAVGTGTKKKGDVNIVVVVDISGSTGAAFGDATTIDVEKALAVGVLRDLSLVNNVGVVAFNSEGYLIENVSLMLTKSEKEIEDKILRLKDSGSTSIISGLLLAHNQLQNLKGSKNIILISDGKAQDRDGTVQAANFVASRGTRIYAVGVGQDTDVELMKKIADIGGGAFFQPTTRQQLKLIFGETEMAGDRRLMPLSVFDKSHFITDDLELKGNIYGFNVVAPKQGGKLLVATDTGDPILVVGRWGLGRVAVLATDDGGLYAGELLGKENSRLYTKTLNWLIGDPERKNEYFLMVPDGFEGEIIDAVLRTSLKPAVSGINFIRFDKDLYKASIFANETGVFNLAEAIYAVNYNTEYLHPAVNPILENAAKTTNGKMFYANETDDMIAFIKAASKREIHENKNIAWIFALIAVLLYLGEICYRRIVRNFNQ